MEESSPLTDAGQLLQPDPGAPVTKKHLPEVVVVRNLKEYIGESVLIVFSVVLALILSEVISKMNENRQTRELIRNIRSELINNKDVEQAQYLYHLSVLKNIDSALTHPEFQQKLLVNDEFILSDLAPHGILYGTLVDAAWTVAKSQNIASRLDMQKLTRLTSIYNDQGLIIKVEDEIGKLLLNPDSRKKENLRVTLLLFRDNFRGWATYRAPELLEKYQRAIDELGKE